MWKFLDEMSTKQLWLLFKIFIIAIVSYFVIGIILCSNWLVDIIGVFGIATAILWYRSARNHLKKKEVI